MMAGVSETCPRCGGPVSTSPTCHTYEQFGRWMACARCDSAVEWSCDDYDCGWDFTQGLNPRNPRAAANEAQRPPWLRAGLDGTGS